MKRDDKRKKWLRGNINRKNKKVNINRYIRLKGKKSNSPSGTFEGEPLPDRIPPVVVTIQRGKRYKAVKFRTKARNKPYVIRRNTDKKEGNKQ